MNKFDKAVNKKTNDLISKNITDEMYFDEEIFKKFKTIARALIREESRGVKESNNPKSLYSKTWKAAGKYKNFVQ